MSNPLEVCRLCDRPKAGGEVYLQVVVPLATPPRAWALCADCAEAVVDAWEVAVRNGDEGEEVEAV